MYGRYLESGRPRDTRRPIYFLNGGIALGQHYGGNELGESNACARKIKRTGSAFKWSAVDARWARMFTWFYAFVRDRVSHALRVEMIIFLFQNAGHL